MVILYSAKRLLAPAIVRCLWMLVLAGSVGACQRASYQFQPIDAVVYQAASPTPLEESAVVTIAAVRLRIRPIHALRPLFPTHATVTASVAARAPRQHQDPGPVAEPVRYRSQGVALLLAILNVIYLPLSLHNFYLGYYGRGAAAIGLLVLGVSLFAAGFTGALFGGEALSIAYVGVAILGGWFIWQLSDLVRIILRDLKPKNGDYKPKFF
jgi:hypothetical protein